MKRHFVLVTISVSKEIDPHTTLILHQAFSESARTFLKNPGDEIVSPGVILLSRDTEEHTLPNIYTLAANKEVGVRIRFLTEE